MRTLRRRTLTGEQMHGRSVNGRNPRLARNMEVMRQLLEGIPIGVVARSMSLSVTAVRHSLEAAINEVLWESKGEHPFSMEKYPHAYDKMTDKLQPRWLKIPDLIAEKEFVTLHLDEIVRQARECANSTTGVLKND